MMAIDLQNIAKCDACGATNVLGYVACSAFGAQSFAYCEACLAVDKEPYRAIVNDISCAGRWPEDINPIYQKEVRRQLKLHGKTEEEFAKDVDRAIFDLEDTFINLNEYGSEEFYYD